MNAYKIIVKDEETGEWRDAEESDGLTEPNDFTSRWEAVEAAKNMIGRCAYRIPFRVVED